MNDVARICESRACSQISEVPCSRTENMTIRGRHDMQYTRLFTSTLLGQHKDSTRYIIGHPIDPF